MVELVDSMDLGSIAIRRAGSSPAARTITRQAAMWGLPVFYARVRAVPLINGSCDAKALIRLPKTETPEDVLECEQVIERLERENNLPVGSTGMMAAIESAEGILNARAIACSSKRLVGIALGAEDYVTDLKTTRSEEGTELFFGRSMLLHAARAAGIAAIDCVYSNVNDEEGLIQQARLIHTLGFDGKSIINPRQIDPVHKIFTPAQKDIEKSVSIIAALNEARAKGSGVIALNGKMIDRPIVLRAVYQLELAKAAGVWNDPDFVIPEL